MAEEVLFIGPIADQGGPAIKNRIMAEHLQQTASLKTYNTYNRSIQIRLGAVLAILFAKQKFVIVSVSRKGRNLLYPFLLLKQKLSGIRYCCVVIGGNVKDTFRAKAPVLAMQKADLVTLETRGLVNEIKTAYRLPNAYWLPNYKEIERDTVSIFSKEHFHEKPLRFLFLSSMRNAKGIKTLLCAFRQAISDNAPATLDFYGPIREDLDKQLLEEIEKSSRIHYCGTVSNAQVIQTMQSYHVFVFPTEYIGEGFPAVLVEAMAAGLPVIASDMNDNPEIVQEGRNGWVFAHGNINQLEERIQYCIDNRDILFQVSENNRTDALQYEADVVLKAFESKLREKGWPV